MDSGDIASIVALVLAVFALLVALAQVAQQYIATAQNMRKCDKSVWGPMPGHSGRRVWTWHQLRFRIVYDMPNILVRSPLDAVPRFTSGAAFRKHILLEMAAVMPDSVHCRFRPSIGILREVRGCF